MKRLTATLSATLATAWLACAALAQANEEVVIVYDASGSMWGQIDGVSKMEIAQEVMAELINEWDENTPLGLVAYGHRRQGDCRDIETLIEPGPLNKTSFIDTVNAIKPRGKTPISASLEHAADLLSYRDSQSTIVLISDGLETCNADPCELSERLARQGVQLTTHVVGFDLEADAHESLACIADNTGGLFVPANNAAELHDALDQVQVVMGQPESQPAPTLPDIGLTVPEQVTTGAHFTVSWSDTVASDDYYTVVPAGADEGETGDRGLVRDKREGTLTAPAEPGLYEVRYILREGMKTLTSAPLEVVKAEVAISAPEEVTTGAYFTVSWSDTVASDDYYTVVPAGAGEGETGDRGLVRDKREGTLTAPAEPGLYEVRYVLREGMKTLASAPLEVVKAEIAISAPEEVTTGAHFTVSWSDTVANDDYYTVVPAGAGEGETGDRGLVRDKREGTLTAPAEPGLYEVRYILREGMKTLASAPLEVVNADVTINAPDIVRAATPVTISWSDTVASDDYYTVVPAGADEGKTGDRGLVRDKREGTLTAPAEPGLYEVRYVLREGMKTLASAPLEVVGENAPLDHGAGLSVQKKAAPGETIVVTWSGGSDSGDQRIALARKEQPDFSWVRAQSIGEKKSMELTIPDDPGTYEVRFLDVAGRELLGRSVIEVQ
ncbi:vWA domain-containing protein [Halomonas piscis]|uniref:vWA domain-containing protein n=1 Tax=Halomonas piscis TaxID=3031727 RepID=UPI00289B38F4|nr:VWA domain-containing protein [Halomonas piscis]